MTSPDPYTVPVHIKGSDIPMGSRPRPRRHRALTTRQFTLTANAPLLPLFSQDLTRKCAYLQVPSGGNPVTLCSSKSDAQNGEGAPLAAGLNWLPLETTEQAWITAVTFPATLSLVIINEATED